MIQTRCQLLILRTMAGLTAMVVVIASGTGCATVEPYQKQAFSCPSMQVDGDPIRDMLTEHIYFSREAASGGESIGGGGCGCN